MVRGQLFDGVLLQKLRAAAELVDLAAIAFGGSAGGRRGEVHHRFPFFGDFAALLAAGFGFEVKRLRDGGWATDVAELKDMDFELGTLRLDVKHIADVNFAGRFGGLAVALDASEFAGASGERARFEETRGPEVFVDAEHEAGVQDEVSGISVLKILTQDRLVVSSLPNHKKDQDKNHSH